MPLKIQKFLTGALSLPCLLLLTACMPDWASLMGGENKPQTIEVSQMTTPALPKKEDIILYCRVGLGSALFGRNWYDISDTQFILHQGDHVNIAITRSNNSDKMTIQAFFDGSGQKLIFCPVPDDADPGRRITCASLYTLDEDLRDGIKRTFDIPSAVRGSAITCAFTQDKLKPLATPAGRGN